MPGYCWFPTAALSAPHHPPCSPLMPLVPLMLSMPFALTPIGGI
jgi:hypothetical protein